MQLYLYFGNALNYNTFTHPNLVLGLPFLKRYYLPKRLRDSFKPRLEPEGLWEEGVVDRERERNKGLREIRETRDEKVATGKRKIKHAFAQEKVSHSPALALIAFHKQHVRFWSEPRSHSPSSTDCSTGMQGDSSLEIRRCSSS
jgi:hypothetical protein